MIKYAVHQITVAAARLFDGRTGAHVEHFGLAEGNTTLVAILAFTDGGLGCISVTPGQPVVARMIETATPGGTEHFRSASRGTALQRFFLTLEMDRVEFTK